MFNHIWPLRNLLYALTFYYMNKFASTEEFESYDKQKAGVFLLIYPGDTRPEFKMWGGASKSVFVLVLKICQHQFASKTLSC